MKMLLSCFSGLVFQAAFLIDPLQSAANGYYGCCAKPDESKGESNGLGKDDTG